MGGGNINKKQTKQEFEERFFIETKIKGLADAASKIN
jgi:hypothetical protein